jgi:hypothetical protein
LNFCYHLAILRIVMCATLQQLELAIRLAVAAPRYRHFDKQNYVTSIDSEEDDAVLAFVDPAAAEAEMRETEARLALDEHTAVCRSCSINNSN